MVQWVKAYEEQLRQAARKATFIATGVLEGDIKDETPLPENLRGLAIHLNLALKTSEYAELMNSRAKTFGQLLEELKVR